ncbi:MAG: hypothetical protein IT562_07610 [Alphaproteobacteria bacterium]|nr:hypothetical protein [Alphaproteobacteria bacterium]
MLLGCMADDLTGATDLALMFARNGLHTVQTIGVPGREVAGRCGLTPRSWRRRRACS